MRQIYDATSLLNNLNIYSIPKPSPFTSLSKPQKVLLTGATGFLGRHILYELIKKQINVVCLIRSPNVQSAHQRLKEVINTMPLSLDTKSKALQSLEVITPHILDKDMPSFDCLIHSAANISLSSSFSQSFKDNVVLTKLLYKIAKKNNAHFVHISTLSVFVSSNFPESIVSPYSDINKATKFFGNYASTKYLAEAFLFNQKDIPLSVYRLGQLASSLWYAPQHDPIKSIIDATKLSGIPSWFKPKDSDKTDLISTSEVASLIVKHLALPNVYHLASPCSLSAPKMLETLQSISSSSSNWQNHKHATRALLRYSNPLLHEKYPFWDVFQSSNHTYEQTLIKTPAHNVFSNMLQYSIPPYPQKL